MVQIKCIVFRYVFFFYVKMDDFEQYIDKCYSEDEMLFFYFFGKE